MNNPFHFFIINSIQFQSGIYSNDPIRTWLKTPRDSLLDSLGFFEILWTVGSRKNAAVWAVKKPQILVVSQKQQIYWAMPRMLTPESGIPAGCSTTAPPLLISKHRHSTLTSKINLKN